MYSFHVYDLLEQAESIKSDKNRSVFAWDVRMEMTMKGMFWGITVFCLDQDGNYKGVHSHQN